MKNKIFTLLLCIISISGIINSVNASTIVAGTGAVNWSTLSATAADSVVVPSGSTVTIDGTTSTCHGLTIESGGVVIQNANFYVCNININSGGIYKGSGGNSANKSLFWGYLYTTAAAPQTGSCFITNNGRFGGTAAGTEDGIAIFFSELATSLTIDGASTAVCYIGRLMANNGTDQTTSTDFNLNIKQNLTISMSGGSLGFSLQNNKKFVGTRTLTIFPGFTVTTNANAKFHANNAAPTNDEGNFIYNIYGTLDVSLTAFDVWSTSFAGSTHSITMNLGNGTDYAVLKLGRDIRMKKYYTGQTITMNWNNPKSRVVFAGNGGITITSSGSYTGGAYVDDVANFPSAIRNLSYENTSTSAALVMPRKVTVTDTLYSYGYGNKMYVGAVIDGTAKSATLGKLFNYNNNAYVVTAVTGAVTTVSNTTLGNIASWVKGTTVTDAAGNSYYCDSVGIYAGTVKFVQPASGASTTAEEFTGAPVQVTGNVINDLLSTYIGRFSAATYIGGNLTNGAGTIYFAKNSTVNGTFTNNGTVTLAGDIATGNLVNNGTFTLGTKLLYLSGNVSGSNSIDASTGLVQYEGSADRTITGFLNNTFAGLRLNTTGTISLGGATTVTGLTLTKGKLALGDNDFSPASISGGSSAAFVVTNGTGKLILATADATEKLFPIGSSSSSYDPVSITPTTGSFTSAKVSTTLSGVADSHTSYNQKEWLIMPTVASSSVVKFSPSTTVTTAISDVIGQYIGSAYQNTTVTKTGNSYSGTFSTFEPFVTGTNDLGTGIDAVTSKLFVSVVNHLAVVNGTQSGQLISVYNTGGQLLNQIAACEQQTALNLNTGMYVIKVGNKVMKAIL